MTTSNCKPLTFVGWAMIPLFVLAVAGISIDPRIVTGAPVWLKPAKFAISTAIYCLTLAWVFGYIKPMTRFVKGLGWAVALTLALEIAIIFIQAARGTTSHFNTRTPLDQALFRIMGIAIAILWLASAGITFVLFRQTFSDRAWGWALRLGMLITLLGSATGGFMVRPAGPMQPAGAHTVGGLDGGPGVPVAGWSREHGDLRAPHFFGLHGLQVVPFLAWLLLKKRRRTDRQNSRTVVLMAATYAGLIAALTWQALRGQSILSPDLATLTAFGVLTLAAAATTLEAAR